MRSRAKPVRWEIQMQYRELGHGLKVSAIGIGCMPMIEAGGNITYGAHADVGEATATIHRAIDLGVTFFDTAEMYGPVLERGTGRARDQGQARRARHRHQVRDEMGRQRDGRASTVRPRMRDVACEGSLKRLGIETIDLFYQHRVDPNVPIEDTRRRDDGTGQGREGSPHRAVAKPGPKHCAARQRQGRSPRCKANIRCGNATWRTKY